MVARTSLHFPGETFMPAAIPTAMLAITPGKTHENQPSMFAPIPLHRPYNPFSLLGFGQKVKKLTCYLVVGLDICLTRRKVRMERARRLSVR